MSPRNYRCQATGCRVSVGIAGRFCKEHFLVGATKMGSVRTEAAEVERLRLRIIEARERRESKGDKMSETNKVGGVASIAGNRYEFPKSSGIGLVQINEQLVLVDFRCPFESMPPTGSGRIITASTSLVLDQGRLMYGDKEVQIGAAAGTASLRERAQHAEARLREIHAAKETK